MTVDHEPLLPPIPLFVAHAPAAARDAWRWLWQFDQRLVRLAAEPSEPMLAQIRLAWWRDQLTGEGKAEERRDPVLTELDAMVSPVRDITRQAACALVDAMEAMMLGEGETRDEGAARRGQELAGALARMTGRDAGAAEAIGAYWGLAQLAPAAFEDDAWQARVDQARQAMGRGRMPRSISLMRMHARRLLSARGRPLGPADGMRLMAHALTGL